MACPVHIQISANQEERKNNIRFEPVYTSTESNGSVPISTKKAQLERGMSIVVLHS